MELPQHERAPHREWIAELARTLPERMGSLYLPEAPAARWALSLAGLLALPGAWLARRRERSPPAPWPGRGAWLLALTSPALPFALLCPALAVQQWGPLPAFAPAALLAAALLAEGALALPSAALGRLGAVPARIATLALAAVCVVSVVARTPAAPSHRWPASTLDPLHRPALHPLFVTMATPHPQPLGTCLRSPTPRPHPDASLGLFS